MPSIAAPLSRSAAKAAPRPGPRPGFTRDEIVDCALRLMDREGHAALSFRAVARELDIAAGALSRYFPHLADLQDAVAAEVMSGLKPVGGGPRQELRLRLARFGMGLLELTRAHPYLVEILGPASARVIARISADSLRAMLASGLGLERANALYSVVSNLSFAWGMRDARPRTPEMSAAFSAAAAAEFRELVPAVVRLGPTTNATYRRWLLLCIDGLLK